VIAEESLYGAADVLKFSGEAAEFVAEKIVGGTLERIIVVIPPGLFGAGNGVDVDVFRLNHFKEAGAAVGASPTAGAAAAVRRFRDGEVTDGVVDHNGSGSEARRDGAAAGVVGGPDAGGESEGRIVGATDGFVGAVDGLHRENGAEGFFLEKAHRGIDGCNDGWFEEARAEVGASVAAAENFCTASGGVGEEIFHALDVLRADEWPDVRGGIGAVAETEGFCFFDAQLEKLLANGALDEETFDGEADLAAVGEAAPERCAGGYVQIGVGEN